MKLAPAEIDPSPKFHEYVYGACPPHTAPTNSTVDPAVVVMLSPALTAKVEELLIVVNDHVTEPLMGSPAVSFAPLTDALYVVPYASDEAGVKVAVLVVL